MHTKSLPTGEHDDVVGRNRATTTRQLRASARLCECAGLRDTTSSIESGSPVSAATVSDFQPTGCGNHGSLPAGPKPKRRRIAVPRNRNPATVTATIGVNRYATRSGLAEATRADPRLPRDRVPRLDRRTPRAGQCHRHERSSTCPTCSQFEIAVFAEATVVHRERRVTAAVTRHMSNHVVVRQHPGRRRADRCVIGERGIDDAVNPGRHPMRSRGSRS